MKPSFKRTCYTLAIFLAWVILPLSSFAQTTGYSGTGVNIDVKYHRAEWTIDPGVSKYITGTVTTYFKTTQNNVSTISFDLNKPSFNNGNLSVKYHGSASGVSFSFPTTGNTNILRITLPVTLANNVLDSVSISYAGAPPAFSDYGEGYERGTVAGGSVIYTLAESYGDEDWWPCKADMQDKIDSMDFIVTTPSAYRAATNGVLLSDVIAGANRIMTYKHRYPIASYLVAIGVANYNVFDRGTVNINGTNVPIVYYIYAGRGANPTTQLNAMDFCKQELVAFSNKYGDYPFKKEKYGMYEFGWGGGMEHQTFSAMGWSTMSSWSVIAHELAHQWFGDKVTFSTWNHLWLAEGFAKYSEVLAAELVSGLGQNPISHRTSIKSTAMSTSTTPVYLSAASIANSNTIWTTANDNAIYQRGAMVVSMLRKLAGDTKFFQALRNYLNDPVLAYRSAVTDDLKNHFEAVLGVDLDGFFTDYINGTGNPAYDVRWGNSGNGINIELTTQRRSSAAVSYFRTPVVLRISNGLSGGAKKDTTVVIYDQNGQLSYAGNGISSPHSGKILGYFLSFIPAVVTVDPDAETLVRGQDGVTAGTNRVAQSTVAHNAALDVSPLITLPINIQDFYGIAKEEGNLLSLIFASTSDKIDITLERSENGTQFNSLGAMQQADATAEGLRYQFLDNNISTSPAYYYRVKTTDETGIVKYSRIVKITNENSEAGVHLLPNPANMQVIIEWTPPQGNRSETEIKLINMAGQLMWTKKTSATAITVSTETIPAGSYFVQLKMNEKVLTKKLVIRR